MLKQYSFFQIISLVINLLRTKLMFPNARLIRFPFDIRGRKYVTINKGFTTGVGCRIEAYPENKENVITIGDNVQINDYVHFASMKGLTIGNNVLIASKVFISDLNHGSYSGNEQDSPEMPPNKRKLYAKPITIEDNVWIGEMVSVLGGVTIGKGSIIGAMSVVTKSIPPNSIAVGVPAKVVKTYNFESKTWEKNNE